MKDETTEFTDENSIFMTLGGEMGLKEVKTVLTIKENTKLDCTKNNNFVY